MTKHFIGIDLSTTPESIGACVLTETESGKLELTDSPITLRFHGSQEKAQNAIINLVQTKIKDPDATVIVAIDVPFGWPIHFSEAVTAHTVGKSFGGSTQYPRERYRYRQTDRFLRDALHRDSGLRSKLHPLSVSTDRLGLTAIFGSEIISRLISELGFDIDISGKNQEGSRKKTIIEVYPKATLLSWAPVVWMNSRNQTAEIKLRDYLSTVLTRANPLFDDFQIANFSGA